MFERAQHEYDTAEPPCYPVEYENYCSDLVNNGEEPLDFAEWCDLPAP